ncbi:hypothetical protein DAIF1_10880 [Stenotrophomonas indicatrix]|nr:hypothetical protein DAIF1_10880 [Stenotrophomonas indicatrix]
MSSKKWIDPGFVGSRPPFNVRFLFAFKSIITSADASVPVCQMTI